jgi:sugar phosphate permease
LSAVFFIVNWTPVVFQALKYSRKKAATAASLYSAMGAVGGLLLMRFSDKRGAIAITIMPVMTVILVRIILSTSLPVRDIFAVLAVCPAVLAICIYMVGRMHRRILGREALAADAEAAVLLVPQQQPG